jgi:hypothetical protein
MLDKEPSGDAERIFAASGDNRAEVEVLNIF